MNSWQTPINIPDPPFQLDYTDQILSLGSCFAKQMGAQLHNLKYATSTNPLGVMYNPVSLYNCLCLLLGKKKVSLVDFIDQAGVYKHWDIQSKLQFSDPQRYKEHLDTLTSDFQSQAGNSATVILTLGTAYVWEHIDTQQIVANCHKMPAAMFTHSVLEPDECIHYLSASIQLLQAFYNQPKIILTLSPIRHLNEGLVNNQLSKSILRYAIHVVQDQYQDLTYFPSYEILMDELRDYRFYDSDMLHPSTDAKQYINSRFVATYCQAEDKKLHDQIQQLHKMLAHRPMFPASEAYQTHVERCFAKLFELEEKHPELDWSPEHRIAKNLRELN